MKKTSVRFFCAMIVGVFCCVLLNCGTSSAAVATQTVSVPASVLDELDAAIRETSNYLNGQLPKGNKLMILNFQSEFPALSEYIIDELIANTVNDRVFTVVDRQQLDAIRAELGFQMSGEVDDATAQSLGRMAGAQIIISGAVSQLGDLYRLRVRALNVQTTQIEGQFNRNIPNSPTVAALVQSRATGYGGTAAAKPGTAGEQVSEKDLIGTWKGSYVAGQGETALILTIYEERGAVIATFDFFNLPGKRNSAEGKYYMSVTYNQGREKFYLKGTQWIDRPNNYIFANLEGTIAGNVFSGFLTDSTNRFSVTRQ